MLVEFLYGGGGELRRRRRRHSQRWLALVYDMLGFCRFSNPARGRHVDGLGLGAQPGERRSRGPAEQGNWAKQVLLHQKAKAAARGATITMKAYSRWGAPTAEELVPVAVS